MIIREGTKEDVPEIVKVLKASLGENDLPLSEEIWNYKHVYNPFGPSIVLVAEENQQIIGVRALMKWSWKIGDKNYTALRAVDTATHPEHQGKGIFKRLTLSALDVAEQEKIGFVFNTPNDKSRPGYLKMGWEKAGKLKVGLLIFPQGILNLRPKPSSYTQVTESTEEEIDNLVKTWNDNLLKTGFFFTPKTSEFLKWRFENNPLQEYEVFCNKNFYLAGYVKVRKGIKELRISELIWCKNQNNSEVKNKIKEWAKKFGVHCITFSPKCFIKSSTGLSGNFGPILTIRKLDIEEQTFANLKEVKKWGYSLGDLELF